MKSKSTLQCSLCNNPAFSLDTKFCPEHFMADISAQYKLSAKAQRQLWTMLERTDFKCYYTNKNLAVGVNCALVRSIPKSKSRNADDFVWCDKSLVPTKMIMDDLELLEALKRSVEVLSKKMSCIEDDQEIVIPDFTVESIPARAGKRLFN